MYHPFHLYIYIKHTPTCTLSHTWICNFDISRKRYVSRHTQSQTDRDRHTHIISFIESKANLVRRLLKIRKIKNNKIIHGHEWLWLDHCLVPSYSIRELLPRRRFFSCFYIFFFFIFVFSFHLFFLLFFLLLKKSSDTNGVRRIKR